jgi:hypothetical protein
MGVREKIEVKNTSPGRKINGYFCVRPEGNVNGTVYSHQRTSPSLRPCVLFIGGKVTLIFLMPASQAISSG